VEGVAESEGAQANGREYAGRFLLDAGYLRPFNGVIAQVTRFSLTAPYLEDARDAIGIYYGGGIVDLVPGSLPDRALDDTWMLEMGLTYRHYFNDPHTLFGPYLSLNGGLQFLFWDYRNPVYIDHDKITADSLGGVNGCVGLGVTIERNHWLSAFVEADFGGMVFVGDTFHHFDNDVFENFSFFMVKAGLCLKF